MISHSPIRTPHSAIRNPQSAILLLGPTGSGKTPLGECLEREGLPGRRCVHFDFGDQLRRIASGDAVVPTLSAGDVRFVRRVLDSGALLEDEQFRIAREILQDFLVEGEVGERDCVILNGLPRHPGQAADVDPIVQIDAVVYLDCSPAVVFERIRRNAGGDRSGRVDDSLEAVERKLDLFHGRTVPLLNLYRERGRPVITLPVGVDSQPREMREGLAAALASPR